MADLSLWNIAAGILIAALVPCGAAALRGTVEERIVALELGGSLGVMILLILAVSMQQSWLYDLALALAVLSLPAGLVFTHFFERWL